MILRYIAASALTLGAAFLLTAGSAARTHRAHRLQPSPPPAAAEIYSARALRRARTILQLKLLELRKEHLERVRKAIERHVPVDELLRLPKADERQRVKQER
jgi:hypothetical protein